MYKEKTEPKRLPPVYEIDLSEGWDTVSQAEVFIKQLKKLGIYKANLRFSAFDGSKIGESSSSKAGHDIVFCSEESDFISPSGSKKESCLEYALNYEDGAIAVYDGDKLEDTTDEHGFYSYRIKDPSALVAIIKLK
jgi:hypothetical protein